jgi:hypothetical protein
MFKNLSRYRVTPPNPSFASYIKPFHQFFGFVTHAPRRFVTYIFTSGSYRGTTTGAIYIRGLGGL